MGIIPQPLTEFPWRVLGILLAIAGFGTLVLYSAAGGSITPWAINQGVRFVIFSVMAFVISRVPLELFARFAFPAYGAVLISLVLVELIGGVAGGSQRWINLGFMQLQPSEFMKPIIVLAVARFYALLPVGEIRRWNAIWPALVLIGVPWALKTKWILSCWSVGKREIASFTRSTNASMYGAKSWYDSIKVVSRLSPLRSASCLSHSLTLDSVVAFEYCG